MKEIFTDQNLMLAIVGATVTVAVTEGFNVKMAQKQPLLTMAAGAVLLPVANKFLAPGKKAAA